MARSAEGRQKTYQPNAAIFVRENAVTADAAAENPPPPMDFPPREFPMRDWAAGVERTPEGNFATSGP
ncbi:hypothetical protein CKO51_21165 [Rhodopirellula sp. SM50]|nr:hypothetical protein CKO51_21165 [Rhodopirellula sp. SM50]